MNPLRIVGQVSALRPTDQLREARAAIVVARRGLEELIRMYATRDGVVSAELVGAVIDLHELAGTLTTILEWMDRRGKR